MDNLPSDVESNRLNKLPMQVSVRVCSRSVTLDQFLGWVPGTILSFDQGVASPLEMRAGSRTVGEGEAVKVGPKIGLRLLRIGETPVIDAMMTDTR